MCLSWRNILPAFDASSILHAWINYPIVQFPRLWDWIGSEVIATRFKVPRVAIDEIGHISPDCHQWLKRKSIQELPTTQAVIGHAIAMKLELGIVNDNYHSNGVDENDLLIVASAKEEGCELISNEARQPALPAMKARYKIPAVCSLASVNVPCLDFLAVLTRSGQSFG